MAEEMTPLILVDCDLSGTEPLYRDRFSPADIRKDLAGQIASTPVWTPKENRLTESVHNDAIETACRLAAKIAAVRMSAGE